MGQVLGSDPDQLDGLGRAFADAADQLDAIRADVGHTAGFGPWEGVDADEFRSQWHSQLAVSLGSAASALRDRGGWLLAQADQQRIASGTAGLDVRSWPAGQPGAEWLAAVGGLAGGARSLLDAVATGKYPIDVFDAMRNGHLGDRLHDAAKGVARFADEVVGSTPLRIAGELFQKFSVPVDVAAAVAGTGDFLHGAVTDPRSLETFDDGVGAALGIAGATLGVAGLVAVGTAGAPVIAVGGLVVGGVGLAWEHLVPQEWKQDLHDDLLGAVDGAGELVGDVVDVVGDGAKAAADVISGGVRSLLGKF